MVDPAISRQASRALARASRGQVLDRAEIAALLRAQGSEQRRLLDLAGHLRDDGLERLGQAGIITYSPKVFVPLTRLCRDRCRYCTFAASPAELRRGGSELFLEPAQVLDIARAGAAAGCAEALFTLGDRPEARWDAARQWLSERGYDNTLDYVRAMAIMVLEKTGLLPHLNPGVMSWDELARLKPVAASMGLMLESSAPRLFTESGGPHFGSPDKEPGVRLRTIEDAGRLTIPFTTGLLVGIGETSAEFADSLLRIRHLARTYGHIQEVIIQNFRAKPATGMARVANLSHGDYLNAIAVARVVLGPRMRLQAPPNLSEPADLSDLIAAGIDDWGGVSPVTADHVNPERAWPQLESLRQRTRSAGYELRPRLAVQPEFARNAQRWISAAVAGHVAALADADGFLRAGTVPTGSAWQERAGYEEFAAATVSAQPTATAPTIVSTGRVDLRDPKPRRRGDFAQVFGDWTDTAARAGGTREPVRLPGDVRAALRLAESTPAALAHPSNESAAVALMSATSDALRVLVRIADELRHERVGDEVTYVVNRNINFTNICYTGCRFCAFAQRASDPDAFTLSLAQVGDRAAEAAAAGATEICMQGGIHPELPGTAYFDLAAEVKRRAPGIHLHAFSPMEVHNGAARTGLSVADWLSAARRAGVDSIPGTAAEILDDDIRWILTKGKLPTKTWIDVITAAHELGIPSSSTMMYGHVDAPIHWVRHLRLLREIQERTGGFTEFVGLPFIHHNTPLNLAGISRPGPTPRDDIAITAMARIMLVGAIENIQVSWVKLGAQRCEQLLQAGANDVGGTLMEETISRMAGSEHGSALTVSQLCQIAEHAGRQPRQRDTVYGRVPISRSQSQHV